LAARPLWLALAVTALVTAFRLTGTVDSDVAWQLWIAGRMHAGANLYHDIIETNPPLWFWMALPVDRIASLLHPRVEAVLIVTIGGLVALSLTATDRLIRHIKPSRRAVLLAYGALSLMAVPWMHVGQREQIVLIGSLPYVALIAARREREPVSPLLAVLIGAGAALGFALKHYFLIVPVLLELWLIFGQRRDWRALRPETVAVAATGALYGAGLFVFAPAFFSDVLPIVRLAYGDVSPPSFRYVLKPPVWIAMATLAIIAANYRHVARGQAPMTGACSIAALGFAVAYFAQYKGWTYHSIPLLGCASLALAALLAEASKPSAALRLLAPALLLMPLAAATEERSSEAARNDDLLGAISGLPPGTSVGFIAEDTAAAWSVTLQHQFRYPSRYNGFWMLRAVQRNEHSRNPDPRLADLGRRAVAQTVTDFRCMPPSRIIIQRPLNGRWNENAFDPLPYFLRDEGFAELLGHYRVVSRTTFEVYERQSSLPAPDRAACIRGR
jgi:hypothetical protein